MNDDPFSVLPMDGGGLDNLNRWNVTMSLFASRVDRGYIRRDLLII